MNIDGEWTVNERRNDSVLSKKKKNYKEIYDKSEKIHAYTFREIMKQEIKFGVRRLRENMERKVEARANTLKTNKRQTNERDLEEEKKKNWYSSKFQNQERTKRKRTLRHRRDINMII